MTFIDLQGHSSVANFSNRPTTFEQLCNSYQDSNSHIASRDLSAIGEPLVRAVVICMR